MTHSVLLQSSFSHWFERVAAQRADHLAVVDESRAWTYGELAALSNRIAAALASQWQPVTQPVALLLGHQAMAVAAILGVLRAGKSYVYLDPALPNERNRDLLQIVESSLLLTDSSFKAQAETICLPGHSILNVSDIDGGKAQQPLGPMPEPDAMAVVFFTSGSTGKPKGVIRTQADLCRRAQIDHLVCELQPDDHISALYGFSYAGSLPDLFSTLLIGATLHLFDVKRYGLGGMAQWLDSRRISIFHINASLMRSFLKELPTGSYFPSIRQVRPTQRLLTSDIHDLRKILPTDAVIIHQYASTETGPICHFKIERDTVLDGDVVPVGEATPGIELTLLRADEDASDEPNAGEIVIRSPYLATGYWTSRMTGPAEFNDPALFDKSMPFRTGDFARLRPDGLFELVRREDSLVKIRGYRVSLVSIELALRELDEVEEVIVLTFPSTDEDRVAVAYVVPKNASPNLHAVIRQKLASRLPSHAIPAHFVLLDALPTLANGKVNRQALPRPVYDRAQLGLPYVAPSTPIEMELTSLWATMLGVESVGIHDPFLDLGGNSLQAMRIAARVQEEFGVEIALAELFGASTVAEMALMVAAHLTEQLE